MDFETFRKQYAADLNPQQFEAVRCKNGYIMLLAVPGSGKTTVLITRLAYLIHVCGIAPERILTVTYTVAATNDMREKYASKFDFETSERIPFRTINGICARILKYYEYQKAGSAFEIADDGKRGQLVREIYQEQCKDYLTDSEVKAFLTTISYVKNQMLTEDEINALGDKLEGFPALFKTYQKRMRERRLMDYDDQMVYALRILTRYPEILVHFQNRFPYICVDEAQDTSKIQHQIIALLAQKNGNLFMVGDEDQSIYGFRAAYPKALLSFESEHPGAKVLLLERNYRSTPEIIEKADGFIQKNRNRHPKHMIADRNTGMPVQEIKITSRVQQYTHIINCVKGNHVQTAVLYRDNDCALPLIDLLERQGIAYSIPKPENSFFSHRVVRDICEIITMAAEPSNPELFIRNYYKLSARIQKTAAQKAVSQKREGVSLFQILSEDEDLPDYTRSQCRDLISQFNQLLYLPAHQAINYIVYSMGYGDYLKSRGMDTSKTEILEILGRQESTPLGLLQRLCSLEGILQGLQGKELSPCNLILSTIHSSKGLEYDRVYLIDITDGILPKIGDDVDKDEERRIFYVAMTRAKNELNIFSLTGSNRLSSFCKEIFTPPIKKSSTIAIKRNPIQNAKTPPIVPVWKRASSSKSTYTAKDFVLNRRIRHASKELGSGIIFHVDGDRVTIHFDNGAKKVFFIHILIEKNLVQFE